MTDTAKDVQAIRELEDRRFDAVVAGEFDDFAAVSHPELIYTHSNAVIDTSSLPGEVPQRLLRLPHGRAPDDKIVILGDTALVFGEMKADLTAGGTRKQLGNSSLAVWVRTATRGG